MERLEERLVLSAFTVTNLNDAGPGSLRDAVAQANAAGDAAVITFQSNLSGTVALSTVGDTSAGPAALAVTGNVTIDGNDGGTGLSIARAGGAPNMRLFTVGIGASLSLGDLTLTGGLAHGGNGGSQGRGAGGGGAGLGGAVFNRGTFDATAVTFDANQAVGGNAGTNNGAGGGAGGGGLDGDGFGGDLNTGIGGAGGGANGGAGGTASQTGQAGGFGGGGGGGAANAINPSQDAGDGGFGGGGGSRGYGGGYGGKGGFGGGGGFGNTGGTGGFGGGNTNGFSGAGGGAGFGGAVFNDAGSVSLVSSTFSANTVLGGTATDNSSANAGKGYGAAVFNYNGSLELQGTTLTGNTSDDGGPGAYTLGDGPVADVSADFAVGAAGSVTLTTDASAGSALSLGGTLPAGLTFADNGNGTFTLAGTPALGTAGRYTLTPDASNGTVVGSNSTQTVTLVIAGPPAITSADHAAFTAGAAGAFTVATTGHAGTTLSETGALPQGVTFTDNADGSATIAGTPAAGAGGTYALTLGASNAQGAAAPQTFTLTVDQAPHFTSADHVVFTTAGDNSFTVADTGFPVAALTETGALPAGVTFTDNGDGTATLSGTPAAHTGGAHALTFTADNGVGAADTQSFTLSVDEGPHVITSRNRAAFTTGEDGSFTVQTSGFTAATLAETGALPAGLTFTDNGDGTATLSGAPDATAAGTYTLTLTATDTAQPAVAPVAQSLALTVDSAPAIISDDNAAFPVAAASSFTVRAAGFPAPALTVAGTLPQGLTFHDNGDGTATISGTPAPSTDADYDLKISASNGTAPDDAQDFTLSVTNGPVAQTMTLAVTPSTQRDGSGNGGPPSKSTGPGHAGSAIDFTLDKPLAAAPSASAFSLFRKDGLRSSQMTAANRIKITGVTYDPDTGALSVQTAQPLKPSRLYVLTADASAIRGADGTPLDGTGTGNAGSPLHLRFATGRRVTYIDSAGNLVTLRLKGPGTLELVRRPDGQGDSVILTGATSATTLTGTARRLHSAGAKAKTTLTAIVGLGEGRNLLPPDQFTVGSVSATAPPRAHVAS